MPNRGNALVSFQGTSIDGSIAELFAEPKVAGAMLYLPFNIRSAQQTRHLTRALTRAAGHPILVAVDQEGGQLLAAGPDMTPFAGNMALGAVGDVELTRRVAAAIGRELRAVGINVDLAPVADVASRPDNPSLGIRSFGEDPHSVAAHAAAFVDGLQSQGVAATLKHFPGKGEATVDPHDEMPVLDLDLDRLHSVEFAPFRAGIEAGAHLLMVGHYGLTAVTGDRHLPTSVSEAVMHRLLRTQLHFEGVVVTDALDMGGYGDRRPDAPLSAGADLLLYGPAQTGQTPETPATASPRLQSLLAWLGGFEDPDISVVGCGEHGALATELATRAMTLVRNDDAVLPLAPDASDRILAVMPRPENLTPADTSAHVAPGLARAIGKHHPATTEKVVSFDPTGAEIEDVIEAATDHAVVVVGTLDASPGQVRLVNALLATDAVVVAVALRTPYDLANYPDAPTYICTYGILDPSLDALADALFGVVEFEGRLPVAIGDLYPVGHAFGLVAGWDRP